MAQTHSFSPLALNLPNSRMSVDFTNFTTLQPKTQTQAQNHPAPRHDKPVPMQKLPCLRRRPLPESVLSREVVEKPVVSRSMSTRHPRKVIEKSAVGRSISTRQPQKVTEKPVISRSASTRQPSSRWWTRSRSPSEQPQTLVIELSRTDSSASSNSYASTTSLASTANSSVFSDAQTISTVATKDSLRPLPTFPKKTSKPLVKNPITLTSLPVSLLEQILSYSLCLPLNISIGPQCVENRHMQYRYHHAGVDYIDIQLIRKHPIFLVSQKIRDVALDVFHQNCDFVVDLQSIYHTKVSSIIKDNLQAHQKFWITEEPPKMVRETLQKLSKLHLRLPVASCEDGGHRGREEQDWMDGSDGKGGGSYKIKSLRKEKEDAGHIERCLEAIVALVTAEPGTGVERGRSQSLGRANSLRRKESIARVRSKSREHSAPPARVPSRSTARAQSRAGMNEGDGKRQPLRRMEVVLVKRNPYAMVLPETLAYIKLLRVPAVTGFTKYYFEVEAQKVLWATKRAGRWRGFEPSGTKLLEGKSLS
jgi:hypothetical protein